MASRNSKSMVEEVEQEVNGSTRKIVEELSHGAEVAGEHLKQYTEKAKEVLQSANNTTLAEVEQSVLTYVKENPGKTLLGAAAAGFVAGYLLRGR